MDALGNAVSGLRAAQLQVDVAASNVANTNTPGFQPSLVEDEAQAGGGVVAGAVAGQAPQRLKGVAPGDQPSGEDLTTDTAAQITGSIAYAANARVIDVSAQMSRTLIDILA